MNRFSTLLFICIAMLVACVSTEEKLTKAYSEGETLAKEAALAEEKGDSKNAQQLYTQAIEKYDQAIALDSTHQPSRAAKAHSLYKAGRHQDALLYLQPLADAGDDAASLRDMGLIKLQMGDVSQGQAFLDRAVEIDHSKAMIDQVNKELVQIATKNFDEGLELRERGDVDKGKSQQGYGMSVLMLAYYYDNTRKDLAGQIARYADEVGDYTVKTQYTKLSQQ